MKNNIRENVLEIRRLYEKRKEESQPLMQFLVSKGIARDIAGQIIAELPEDKKMSAVKEAVSRRLNVAGELKFTTSHKLVFVGPTGVGKSTTLLKLAEFYIKQNKRVALMSLDEAKKGSLAEWATSHKIPFFDTPQTESVDLVLIDTEGCNFYLPDRIDLLGEKLALLGEGIEIVLTLSAAAKEVDLYGAIHQFSSLSPTTLCFTKLDETLASGVMINVSQKAALPIRYVAYGFPLPGEVEIAEGKLITHKVLTDFNSEEFQFLRHLIV